MTIQHHWNLRKVKAHVFCGRVLWLLLLSSPLLVPCQPSAHVQARAIPTVSREKADSLARIQVVYQDRVTTFAALSTQLLKQIYGKRTYHGLTPEQIIIGWKERPDVWKDEEMIFIADQQLRQQLQMGSRSYASFAELFDDTLGYRLNNLHKDLPERMRPMAMAAPAEQELDEKVGLLILLTQGRLFAPIQDESQAMSPLRVEIDVLLNHWAWQHTLVLLLLACILFAIWRHSRGRTSSKSR